MRDTGRTPEQTKHLRTTAAILLSAAGGVLATCLASLALLPRVRPVEVVTVVASAVGAGAALTAAFLQFRQARTKRAAATGTVAEKFTAELSYELSATRALLERVPNEAGPWKPHPRSSALGHLAQLVARLPGTMANIVKGIDLDLATGPGYTFEATEALVREFDTNVAELRSSLAAAAMEDWALTWKLLYGGEVVDSRSREDVLRNTINHFVHHRGQLTVYLRMKGVPLPPLYGPTADEQ